MSYHHIRHIVEDTSQRLATKVNGANNVQIPDTLWVRQFEAILQFIQIPFEQKSVIAVDVASDILWQIDAFFFAPEIFLTTITLCLLIY